MTNGDDLKLFKFITIKKLANALGLTPHGIHTKIKRGSIPKECVFQVKNSSRVLINITLLCRKFPNLKGFVSVEKESKLPDNLISIKSLSKKIGIHPSTIRHQIKSGIWPVVELPSMNGTYKKIKIDINKTIEKYPELKDSI